MYRCVYSNNNNRPIRWDISGGICNGYSTGGIYQVGYVMVIAQVARDL